MVGAIDAAGGSAARYVALSTFASTSSYVGSYLRMYSGKSSNPTVLPGTPRKAVVLRTYGVALAVAASGARRRRVLQYDFT